MQSSRLMELALKGLEAERDRIEIEIADVRGRLNGSTVVYRRCGCHSARKSEKDERSCEETNFRRNESSLGGI